MKPVKVSLLCSVAISVVSLSAMAQRSGNTTGRVQEQRPAATRPAEQAQSGARVREAEALNNMFARMEPAAANALATVPGATQGLNLSGIRPAVQSALNSSRTLTVAGQQVAPRNLISVALTVADGNQEVSNIAALSTGLAAVADTEAQTFDAAAPGNTEVLGLAQQALAKQVDINVKIMSGAMQITPEQVRDHARVTANTVRHFISMGSAAYGNVAYLRAIMDEVRAANNNAPVAANDARVVAKAREIIACQ